MVRYQLTDEIMEILKHIAYALITDDNYSVDKL